MSDKNSLKQLVQSKLADIKKLVFNSEEVKFVDTLLADGTTAVKIEPALEVGATVSIIGADGTPAPAPAGEHQLADGSYVVVDESGVITEVKPMDSEQETEIEVEMAAKFKEIADGINAKIAEATAAFTEQVNAYKAEAEAAKSEFEKVTKAYEDEKANTAKFKSEVVELLTKISESEAVAPSTASKQTFTQTKKEKLNPKDEIDLFVNGYLQRINNN